MSLVKVQLTLLLLLPVLYTVTGAVTIAVEVRNSPFTNTIFMSCKEGEDILSNVAYRRTVILNGQETTEDFTNYNLESDGSAKFGLTPSLEGNYSCVDDSDTVSSNYITLVAYPTFNTSFTYPQKHVAFVGETAPPLPCPFLPGLLLQYYTIQWWRGISKITTDNSRYQIQSDFSLVVHDTVIGDASDGYYCKIIVNDIAINTLYTEYGPDISLTVDGGLEQVNTFNNTAVMKGDDVTLSCMYQGYPIPTVRWLVKSRPPSSARFTISNEVVASTDASISLQSTLIISNAETADTGNVQCIGIIGDKLTSSNAILVVLDNDITPSLSEANDGSIHLLLSLPTTIPDVFSLKLRYTSGHDPNDISDTVINDASFFNTDTVDYILTNLPYQYFTLRVALIVYGQTGGYSGPTDPFNAPTPTATPTIPINTVTPTTAPVDTRDCGCDVAVYYSIIGILIAVLIVLVIVMVPILFVLCYYSKHTKKQVPHVTNVRYELNGDHIYATCDDHSCHDNSSHDDHVCHDHSCRDNDSYSSTSSTSPSHSDSDFHGNMMSRPSSQESYSYDHSTTVSPDHTKENHVYAKPDDYRDTKPDDYRDTKPDDYRDTKKKGQSESPRVTKKHDASKDDVRGVMSPSRSEPLLDTNDAESSLVNIEFNASVAVTTQKTTPTMPLQGIPTTELSTFQEYMGTIHSEVDPQDHIYEEAIAEFEIL